MNVLKNPMVSEMEEKLLKASKPSDAVGVAREQLIKAKVQMDNMHAKWKRNTTRLAGVVMFWEAMHCKECYRGMDSLKDNDALCWSHYVGISLAFLMMLGPWLVRNQTLKRVFRFNKETIAALFCSEIILFAYNIYTGNNRDIHVEADVYTRNPNKHYPFASMVYVIAMFIDIYMVRQNDKSYKQFQEIDALYRRLIEKESKSAETTAQRGETNEDGGAKVSD
jgi:hypothetical protein